MWLSAHHIHLPAAQNARAKLRPRWLGPFPVSRVLSPVSYELDLPPHWKMHNVVHISRLKPDQDGSLEFPDRPQYVAPPPPEVIDDEEHFTVEAFLQHRKRGKSGGYSFLVRWKGYGAAHDLWKRDIDLREDLSASVYRRLINKYVADTNCKIKFL